MNGSTQPHFEALKRQFGTQGLRISQASMPLSSPEFRNQDFKMSKVLSQEGVSFAAHAEDNDLMQWKGMTLGTAMFAGAAAGVTEHICMFPVDTVKTRMQACGSGVSSSITPTRSFFKTFVDIKRNEGVSRLYRGLPAAISGAIPSHAAYFATYEYTRKLTGASRETHTPVANLLSGLSATMAHDAIGVPTDVVKQRMQMFGSTYRGAIDCVKSILAKEGFSALYASYMTTVLLNIPYMVAYFSVYEGLQTAFHQNLPSWHLTGDIVSGGAAGAFAGFISTPLDVVKTRLQTQVVESGQTRLNAVGMIQKVYKEEGIRGFTRGAMARVMLFMPSAAICWGVYEGLKRVLPNFNPPDHDHDHDHHHDHHSRDHKKY